jgi:hypothetical protein
MRMPSIHRPRYADVTATLALVVALGGGAYAAAVVGTADIKDGAVTTPKLHHAAVESSKLAPGAVINSKLGADSVDGSNVAPNSLTLSDLLGADTSGPISFSLSAGACGTLAFGVGGAQVGQVAVFSFTGATAVPPSITFGGTKVTSADHVSARVCNVGASNYSVSNLGIRIITFG